MHSLTLVPSAAIYCALQETAAMVESLEAVNMLADLVGGEIIGAEDMLDEAENKMNWLRAALAERN